MSIRLFILQLTGKLKETSRLESERRLLNETYHAFLDAEKSPELERYRELERWVASGEPEKVRLALEKEVFKGSKEQLQENELKKLSANRKIWDFLKVEESPDLRRFLKVEESENLKNYWILKDYSEGEFQQEMRDIKSQKFVGSPEERLLKELSRLKKHKGLSAYFRMKDSPALEKVTRFRTSPKLKLYHDLKNSPSKDKAARRDWKAIKNDSEIKEFFRIENSSDLTLYYKMEGRNVIHRYEELVRETGSEEFHKRVAFLRDNRKLEKSEAWKKFRRFKELEQSDDIRFFRRYKKSALYRNYLDTRESYLLNRYYELQKLTSSAEFKERKAWLEDSAKWEKTREYGKLQEYLQLKKHPKVELFYKYKDGDHFDFLKEWEVSFSDEFGGREVDSRKWVFNTLWGELMSAAPCSQPGDLQGYSRGGNTVFRGENLAIQVRKEKIRGQQWRPGTGFVPVEFDYSSDLLSTAGLFEQKEGIFEAKIRFSPVKGVVSSCHLLGNQPGHQLTLVETGPRSRMGVVTFSGNGKSQFEGIRLNRLKGGKFYLFRLEWEKNRFVWKINDRVVYETSKAPAGLPLHFNLLSLVVDEIPGSRLPADFEVAWVRSYRKLQA